MLSKLLKQPKTQLKNMSTTTKQLSNSQLSEQDIHKINLLIPRLILTNNTPTAIRLITTSLSLTRQHNFLSLNILTLSLSKSKDMTQSMSLLNSLKHTPKTHSHIPQICEFLIKGYLRECNCKEALKVYSWMVKNDWRVNGSVFGVLVNGLCANGEILDGVRVLREMVKARFVPGRDGRERVFRSLLRDGRVRVAKELDEGLRLCVGDVEEGVERVVELLDRIVREWTE